MNKELAAYIKAEAIISGAFNFFINGMAAALIHHKADSVAVDPVSLAIDLFITCMSICILTALFSKASLKRTLNEPEGRSFQSTKTTGILTDGPALIRFLSRLFRCTILFGVVLGAMTAVAAFALTASFFTLLSITEIPFGVYVAVKCIFCTLLGGGMSALELYSGMNRLLPIKKPAFFRKNHPFG